MSQPVDLTDLREMTGGDTEIEQELFAAFFESSQEAIAEMEANCVDGDNEVWRSNAHALKGTALNLGAAPLGELCRVAQEGHGEPAAGKQQMLAGIKAEYEQVKQLLLAV